MRAGTKQVAEGTALTDSAVVASKSILGTAPAATIYAFLKNATSTANESLTATVDAHAYLNTSSSTRATNAAGRYALVNYTEVATGESISVWSDGTAGKATVTIKTTSGVTVGTKSIYFYGAVTKLAVDADPKAMTIVRAGGKTLSDAFSVSATDAAGMPVPGLTLTCTSSDTTVIGSCDAVGQGDGTYLVSLTSATGSVSGKSATITVKILDPADTTNATYLSTTQAVTTGSSVNTVTITTDKSSYTAGEQMIVTVTAKDSLGNPVYDGATLAALSSNKSVTGLTNVATTFTGGVADSISRDTDGTVKQTYRVFAPVAGGEFSIYLDYTNAALASVRATATASVDDGSGASVDAANEATDAANAATDAANAAAEAADAATAAAQDAQAAVAALATSVSSLIAGIKAQITSLTNLVIKIQKKVKA